MKTVIELIRFLKERKRVISQMNHLSTQEITDGVYTIKTKGANFFLVKDGDEYIAFDAGAGDLDKIKAKLAKLDIDPGKVKTAFLTHTDFDHTAALDLFKMLRSTFPHKKYV